MRCFWGVVWLLATLVNVSGQSIPQAPAKLEFEVATIRPAAPIGEGANPVKSPERVDYVYASIKNLLMIAYDLPNLYHVLGPSWIDSERYDIVTKLPAGTTGEQFKVMLQNLLADRFKLRLHRETKELPLFELVVGKSGSKLKDGDLNATGRRDTKYAGRNWTITNPKASMADVIQVINSFLDRPVMDKTGLTGTYDLKLTYTPDTPGNRRGAPDPNDISIFTAVQEQLGLRLEAKTGPLNVVVVDQGEKTPTEN